ncbi:MAG TPA: hypothetical protein VMX74_11365 [Pirellulales bacterium]|nr:hypothetical protein [Pirellulales bacterium]
MAKEDFKNFVVKQVELQWPRLNQPYRYNNNERRTEACEPTAKNASYSVSWTMDTDDAKKLYMELQQHFKDCASRNSKIGEFGGVFGHKKDDEGNHHFTAKRNCVNSSGALTTPPTVVDARKQPLSDKAIWSGSLGSVAFSAVAVADPEQKWGITLLLSAVQVIKPKYGSTAIDEFDEYETTEEDDHRPQDQQREETTKSVGDVNDELQAAAFDADDPIPF